MTAQTQKNWWLLTINGVIAILLGAFALFSPHGTLITIAKYFGVLLLISALIMGIGAYVNKQKQKSYTLLMIEAIVSLVLGVIILFFTKQTLELFVILIGIWAIILGVIQLVILTGASTSKSNKRVLLINGLLTLLFGILVFFNPFQAEIIFTRIIGVIALAFGILMIYISFQIRNAE